MECHLIGDYLVNELNPRFSKQKPRDPNKTREEETIEWLNQNHNLDIHDDKQMVQVGFVSMFYLD